MNEDITLITYKLKLLNSYRFMNRPLLKLADKFSEINKCKCKILMNNAYILSVKVMW